ncbi:phosphotransferase [Kitasatospora sp. NBC_01250]|uniref:phosphotransferase enzyme family protein n=1 Tax=Kitasatospora sp. NBC_01250 TaxID=2903571 RepID=UPI002E318E65|nr:phosphotransferase [Kitasatospora sp. NBC_01250]
MPDDHPSTEQLLTGGGVNHVVRSGSTVRRPTGDWTPTVHALLDHLRAAGFTGSPRAHGLDAEGREILDFLPGQVPGYPLPAHARSDATLRAVGRLLREYHDATAGFAPPADARWYRPASEPAEVVCHGDIAPYNCVFRDGEPVAFIDFDAAHPGPRIHDVGYAAYRFVPLTAPDNPDFTLSVGEQARRLRLFADAYRLAAGDRAALVRTAAERLDQLVRHLHQQAAQGNAAFAGHLAAGHDSLYRRDAAHLRRHAARLTAALA